MTKTKRGREGGKGEGTQEGSGKPTSANSERAGHIADHLIRETERNDK